MKYKVKVKVPISLIFTAKIKPNSPPISELQNEILTTFASLQTKQKSLNYEISYRKETLTITIFEKKKTLLTYKNRTSPPSDTLIFADFLCSLDNSFDYQYYSGLYNFTYEVAAQEATYKIKELTH